MAKNWFQNNWGNALGALIVATGAIASGLPARANDAVADWQLAQVSSYGNSPTPLNLRPRVHIPLPSSRSSDYYPRYRRSQDHYDHYDDHHDHHASLAFAEEIKGRCHTNRSACDPKRVEVETAEIECVCKRTLDRRGKHALFHLTGGFGSLPEVMSLFSDPRLVLAGWMHYLAFDLLVGTLIVRDGIRERVPHLAVVPCLAACFMAGPVGWLLYLLVRGVARRKVLFDAVESGAH